MLTAAKITLNTLHGQFANCRIVNGSYNCYATWECWCEHRHSDNNHQNPCRQNSDSGDDYCPCQAWGGCGGGKWGKAPANNALAVGKRTNVAPASDAPAGHEYSTTAGGECGSEENKQVYKASVCSWKAAEPGAWRSADAACVAAALVAAVDRATVMGAQAAATAALAAAFAEGSACRIT